MRCLIANDKFKGSLTAIEAASAIEAGLRSSSLGPLEVDVCPIADGGEGFTETMCAALGGRWIEAEVSDALGRPIVARYAVTDAGIAIMEMAAASGLQGIDEKDRAVLRSSTLGTGEMLRHAAQTAGVARILIGLGGSATNDGGVGMASALGFAPIGADGERVDPWPGAWDSLAGFERAEEIRLPPIEVASDVTNPLLGPRGATAVFAAQKGASSPERAQLERHLARVVQVTSADEAAGQPGAGAAGGLGFGLMHFLGAELRSGFELVAEALDLKRRIKAADFVITGEGSMDAQSLDGKGPVGVALMARALGTPAYAVGGRITEEVRSTGMFQACAALDETGLSIATLMAEAGPMLTATTAQMLSRFPPRV